MWSWLSPSSKQTSMYRYVFCLLTTSSFTVVVWKQKIIIILCLDIDECAEGTHLCDQTCTNIIGSYSCSCGSSYRLASNRLSCTDIDECAEGTNGCTQICTNTVGNYICFCGSGYRLASDGQTCNGKPFRITTHFIF